MKLTNLTGRPVAHGTKIDFELDGVHHVSERFTLGLDAADVAARLHQLAERIAPPRGEARLRLLAQEILRLASQCDYQIVIASHASPGVAGPVVEVTPQRDASMLFSERMKICRALGIPVNTTEEIVAEIKRLRSTGGVQKDGGPR